MKKSLIALAVAGAMTAPMVAQADATIFGEYVGYISDSDDGDLNIENDTIDIGVKGTVENGIDGLETGYKFLFNMAGDSDNTYDTENANAYMAGDWGTFTLGKQDNPADITEDLGEQGGAFLAGGDEATSASYYTPDMGGFWAGLAITADGDDTTDAVNDTQLGLGFSAGGFGVALGYESNGDNDQKLTTVTGTYEMDALFAFVNIQSANSELEDAGTDDNWSIGAEFAATDAVSVYGEFGVADMTGGDAKQTLVGASYGMGDAYVAIEYSAYNDDAEDAGNSDTLLFAYGLEF